VLVSAQALEHSQQVSLHLRRLIDNAGGWISFSDWMHDVLYAPGLGYYTAGSHKLSLRDEHQQTMPSGDFVTAPELSSAFGYTLARQISQVMREQGLNKILEFGAGSGQLACDILSALSEEGIDQVSYNIIEISQDLRDRQQQKLTALGHQVTWKDRIPENFEGIIIANEVLDAMPVHVLQWSFDESPVVLERGVIWKDGHFAWECREASPTLAFALANLMPPLAGYVTEINLQAQAWTRSLAQNLRRGLILLIDYGFPQSEYYHPQRCQGTLMCHIQHHAHDDPFFAPGLQDITAHVDFSSIAASAHAAGLQVLGYTSQARFLLNAEIDRILMQHAELQTPQSFQAIQKLLSEAEMGELFKVLALGKSLEDNLIGFARGDRRHQL